ncbi:MAG: 3'-5' exonuclease [Planctomycetota bacterium]
MSSPAVAYLVFDIESIADGKLISNVRYKDEEYTPSKAIEKFCAERMEMYGSEFIPYTYHIPVSVAVIKISIDLKIIDIVTLDSPEFRPHVITRHFWEGWRAYKKPTLVSFNGRTFDVPLMELSAYRYGVGIPDWFNLHDRSYAQNRNRYNQASHFDLQDVITNFGTTRLSGGLNLMANLIGRPGKMGIAGHMVQDLYNQGKLDVINNYCRCDVLDTYFVLLRTKVVTGHISLDDEKRLIEDTVEFLEMKSDEFPIYSEYLKECRPWENPWLENDRSASGASENSGANGEACEHENTDASVVSDSLEEHQSLSRQDHDA